MSRPPSSQTTPQFYRVSERDLTEIELHSVDSINDLHRTHPEHSHKGAHSLRMRPPRPAYTPSPNGNLYTHDGTAVSQRGRPLGSKWQRRLQDILTASSSRAYAAGCAIVTLLLLTAFLIFVLVQQGGAIRTLTEAVREKEAAADKLELLIQELQELRRNMTAMRRGT
uniref:Si:dkey-20d21.12 n=1 Tax=Poecilia formosa TaxID=48698 RepID=A0A087X5K6_POEFO